MQISLQLEDGRCVLLVQPIITIGSEAQCTIAFPGDSRVSLNHAIIRRVGERWCIEATGHSFVRVGVAAPARLNWLQVGDEILLGQKGPRLVVTSGQDTTTVATASTKPIASETPVALQSRTTKWKSISMLGAMIGIIGIGFIAWVVVPRVFLADKGERVHSPSSNNRASIASDDRNRGRSDAEEIGAAKPSGIVGNQAEWGRADFLLVNPQHLAIAMRQTDMGFRVEAKASGDEAQQRIAEAWETGTPLIGADKMLTRRVSDNFAVGQTAKTTEQVGREIANWWSTHAYFPQTATLISFNDLRHRRRRVGFRWKGNEGNAEFLELNRPFATPYQEDRPMVGPAEVPAEPLNEALIQPGSLIDPLSDDELRSNVDFLDYCIYHVRRRLSTKEPAYVAVIVNKVECDCKQDSQLQSQVERLRGEIHERLSEAGIAILERQLLDDPTRKGATTIVNEKRLAFERPSPETAQDTGLIGGSHLIAATIRPPARRGQYELSLRVINLINGKITWAGQGDRFDTSEQAIELASSPFLLNTGKVSAITFQSSNTPLRQVTEPALFGGFPLRITSQEIPILAPERVREDKSKNNRVRTNSAQAFRDDLGYVEGSEEDAVLFRGLFERQLQRIPKSAIGTPRDVHSLADVPSAHQMRYMIWRLAKAVVPTAGKVLSVDGPTIRLSLNRSDRLQPADRIRVLRMSQDSVSPSSSVESVIPGEVIVTEVHDDSAVAVVETGRSEKSSVVMGDIVHRQPRQAAIVAVLPVKPDPREPSKLLLIIGPFALGVSKQGGQAAEEIVVSRLASLVEGGLNQANVKTVERTNLAKVFAAGKALPSQKNLSSQKYDESAEIQVDPNRTAELGRLCGATHVLLATLAPTRDIKGQYEVASNLRIVDVETGLVVENLDFTFRYHQMEYWKP